MADEAVIFSGLQITKSGWNVPAGVTTFTDDVSGKKGPTPGAISVSTTGTSVDLSQLTTPGWCKITNLDPTNYVEYGGYDASANVFVPVGEIPPSGWTVIKLSRHLGMEYGTAGTGSSGSGNYLRLRAPMAACNVSVEAYEA